MPARHRTEQPQELTPKEKALRWAELDRRASTWAYLGLGITQFFGSVGAWSQFCQAIVNADDFESLPKKYQRLILKMERIREERGLRMAQPNGTKVARRRTKT
jgi:hypothetical protein